MNKLAVVICSLMLCGCSSDLSRSQAQNLLAQAAEKARTEITFEVTGIVDASVDLGMKEAKLSYVWKGKGREHYFVCRDANFDFPPRSGSAIFRRYDDGWRVETIEGLSVTVRNPEYHNIIA